MKLRLKYTYRSMKNGRLCYRFEPPGGPKRWFRSEPGTPEFLAEWQRYMAGEAEDVKAEERRHVRPGSFAWLVNQYTASAAWARLAPATQKQRLRFYQIFLDKAPDAPADALTARDLRRMRDNRAKTPALANNMLKAVSALYDWALEHELVKENPAKGVKHLPPASRSGFPPWTIEDVRAFTARWPEGTREHLALMLLLFTAVPRTFKQAISWCFIVGALGHSGLLYLAVGLELGWAGALLGTPVAYIGPVLILLGLLLAGIAAAMGWRGQPVRD